MPTKIGEGKFGSGGSSDITPDFAATGYRWANFWGGSQAVVGDALRLTWDVDPVGSGYYGPTLGFYVDDNGIVMQDVYVEFDARFPGNVNGCKFVKFFGRRSEAEGYSNATFNLLWSTGEFANIIFTDGTDTEGDAGRALFFSGGNTSANVGRAWGTAVVSTPQGHSFSDTDWGSSWHHFRFRYKQNSGTSSANEVADGVFYVEIDGQVYLSVTNIFNRHPLNLQGLDNVQFGGWSQDGGGAFDLDLRNIVVSIGGFMDAGSTVSGTLFGTTSAATGAVSGAVKVNGSVTAVCGAAVGSATGTVKANAILSTAAASATVAITGSVVAGVVGSVNAILAAATPTVTGQVKAQGTLAGTLQAASTAVTGQIKTNAAAATTTTPATCAISGIVAAAISTGSMVTATASATSSVAGQIKATGSLSGAVAAATGALAATATARGGVAALLQAATASITGGPIQTVSGVLAAITLAPAGTLVGHVGGLGELPVYPPRDYTKPPLIAKAFLGTTTAVLTFTVQSGFVTAPGFGPTTYVGSATSFDAYAPAADQLWVAYVREGRAYLNWFDSRVGAYTTQYIAPASYVFLQRRPNSTTVTLHYVQGSTVYSTSSTTGFLDSRVVAVLSPGEFVRNVALTAAGLSILIGGVTLTNAMLITQTPYQTGVTQYDTARAPYRPEDDMWFRPDKPRRKR